MICSFVDGRNEILVLSKDDETDTFFDWLVCLPDFIPQFCTFLRLKILTGPSHLYL